MEEEKEESEYPEVPEAIVETAIKSRGVIATKFYPMGDSVLLNVPPDQKHVWELVKSDAQTAIWKVKLNEHDEPVKRSK